MKNKYLIVKVFIYLVLILLAISIIVPVAWVFLASVKSNAEFYRNPWVLPAKIQFQNFADAWRKANRGSYMMNSAIVTALALFLLIAIALPAAYVLALVYAATALPFTIYLLSGYFRVLARDYEEAAYIDGAGYFYTMVRVMIPMARPSIVTVILFNFLAFWNEYIISMTLLPDPELKTLPVGLMNLMAAQRASVQYGQLYAGLVIVMLPTLILYICVQRKFTQGMTVGGLKG